MMPVQKIEPTDHINLKEGSILPSIPVYNGMADNLPAEIMDREFSLTFAPNGKTKFGWKTRPGTFRLAFEAAVQHRPVKDKDDACFIQGALLAGTKQRVKENVATLDMLVYDLDTGAPIDDIITEFVERDQFAVIYSTFSHGKTQTTFPLPQFREKLKLSIDEEITDSHVRAFLRDYRKYHGSIYGPARYVGYKHLPGGVVGIAEHPPIGKYRVLIPLTAPFSILTESAHGNPQVAYQKWKRLYAGFAQALHIDGFDPACMDVSRLFYWPSCPEDPDKRGMEPFACVIVGEALDLSTVVEQDPNNPQGSNPFTEAGLNERVNSEPIETPWLLDAFRGRYRHFQAAAFFSSYYDEKNSDGGKITTECPFNHLHGDPDNVNDRGFYCQDATESRSFVAHCRHTHGADHNNLNYVDQAVKAFNIPPEDLEQFFDVLAEEGNKSESAILEDVETKGGSALIQQLIDKLTPETVGKVPSVLELIAEADVLDLVSEPWLKQIAKQTAGTLPTVRKAYRELQKTRKREADEAKAAKEGEIWIPARGDFKAIEEAALDAIKRKNDPPFLFNDHGALITLHANKTTGRLDREAVTKDRLSWLLNQVATFYQQSDNGRISTSPPLDVVNNIFATPRHLLPVPNHARVVHHPVLSKDGVLVTKQGHDPMTGVYVHMPDLRLLPVSVKPDDRELDQAWEWLFESDGLFGDFPFKDTDDDKGRSTMAHVLALMLLPIIRGVIDGPIPAFVINKPMPGAGSGLFANVWNRTLNGRDCPTYAPPKRGGSEELDKLIFGKLLSDPDSPMFFDNVERLESNSLASAITSGSYAGRKLGVSEVVTMDVRHVWLFSGNNIDPSDELARRMIPINIIPDVPRPELRSDFYHKDLPGWCMEYRPELIWSLCTLVQNWVAKGMPDGKKTLGSFDRWARVTGGILEAAGIGGFLDNISAWRDLSSSSNQQDDEGIEAIFQHVGAGVWFKAGEVFDHFYDENAECLSINVPVRGREEQGKRTSFGTFLKNRKDKIYEIDGRTLKLSIRPGKPVEYRFTLVTRCEEAETPNKVPRPEAA